MDPHLENQGWRLAETKSQSRVTGISRSELQGEGDTLTHHNKTDASTATSDLSQQEVHHAKGWCDRGISPVTSIPGQSVLHSLSRNMWSYGFGSRNHNPWKGHVTDWWTLRYRAVCQFFQSLGLRRIWSDPCCWVFAPEGKTLGLISAHVNDFLFSGDEKEPRWLAVLEAIKNNKSAGDWEHQRFVQCGVLLEQHSDFSFSLSKEKYVEDLKYINFRAHRKRDKQSPTEECEKTQLRAVRR